MAPRFRPLLQALAAVALLAATPGCEDTACIQWTQAEYDRSGCPPQDEAKAYMTVPTDPLIGTDCNTVISVDSEGEFDGQVCCYDVTRKERDDDQYEYGCQ